MKCLALGGAGFIGSTLTDRLVNDGHDVIVFDNLSSGRYRFIADQVQSGHVEFIEGDALIIEDLIVATKGIDLVFHLIGNADISLSANQTDLDLRMTVQTTFNTLEAMRLTNVRKIAFFSGSGVYGDHFETLLHEEYGPLTPVSMYGASKLAAEAYVSSFSHLYGVTSWIFRFANVVGPRQTHGVGYDFLLNLMQDNTQLKILGDGHQSKSYIYVEDALNAVICSIGKSNEPVNIFDVATQDWLSVREIAKLVVDCLELKNVSLDFSDSPVGWPGDVAVIRMTSDKIRSLGWENKLNSANAIRTSLKGMIGEKPWE